MPKLSVIIPVFNGAPYVGMAVYSVLSQAKQDCEVIVIDDGSTDCTAEVLRTFDSQIVVIHQENRGLSAARNRGIEASTGEWLSFLDADDTWLTNFEQCMSEAIDEASEDVGAIYCGWRYIDSEGGFLSARLPLAEVSVSDLLRRNAFPIIAAVVRRESLDAAGLFDEQLRSLEDWDLWLRLALCGFRFRSVPRVLVAYRQTKGSMSRNILRMRDNALTVLDKIFSNSQLSPEVYAMHDEAYGLVRLGAAANLYEDGRDKEGLCEAVNALISYPVLLSKLDTYYEIACAKQPRAFRSGGILLDLEDAKRRIREVLQCVCDSDLQLPPKLLSQARALSELALGELAYQQQREGNAFKHASTALYLSRDRSTLTRTARLAIRSLLGRKIVSAMKSSRLSSCLDQKPYTKPTRR